MLQISLSLFLPAQTQKVLQPGQKCHKVSQTCHLQPALSCSEGSFPLHADGQMGLAFAHLLAAVQRLQDLKHLVLTE